MWQGGNVMKDEQNISTVYEPQKVEKKWYQIWEKAGYFEAKVDRGKQVVFPL